MSWFLNMRGLAGLMDLALSESGASPTVTLSFKYVLQLERHHWMTLRFFLTTMPSATFWLTVWPAVLNAGSPASAAPSAM